MQIPCKFLEIFIAVQGSHMGLLKCIRNVSIRLAVSSRQLLKVRIITRLKTWPRNIKQIFFLLNCSIFFCICCKHKYLLSASASAKNRIAQ